MRYHSKEQERIALRTPYNCCYTIDYRGDHDDQLTFIFRGVPINVIDDVFTWLGSGGRAFGSHDVVREHDSIRRNGFGFWRLAVHINDYHDNFCSVDDFCLLIEARIQAECQCKVKRLSMQKFLNV